MSLLSEREVGAADMVDLTALALGETGRVGGALAIYAVLADASGKQAELVTLRLPEMQPLYATRFAVPSAVSSAFFDAASGWIYLLCAAAQPRIVRLRVTGGEPAALGRSDGLALPWAAAATLLLPFPEQRQLLVFGAARAVEGSEGRPLRVCRIRLGVPLTEVRGAVVLMAAMHRAAPSPLYAPPRALPHRVAGDARRRLSRDAGWLYCGGGVVWRR